MYGKFFTILFKLLSRFMNQTVLIMACKETEYQLFVLWLYERILKVASVYESDFLYCVEWKVLKDLQNSGRFNFTTQFPYHKEVTYKPNFQNKTLGKPVVFDMDMSAGDFLALIYLLKVPVQVIDLKVSLFFHFLLFLDLHLSS